MKFPNLKPNLSAFAATGFTLLAGIIGAAVTGGATGAATAIQSGSMDTKAVGASAAGGAAVGIVAYLVRSPWAPKDE